MKTKLVALLILALASAACADPAKNPSGEQQYRAFQEALRQDSGNLQYQDYLSSSLMAVLNGAESAEERAQLEAQSAFPLWLATETAWYEKDNDTGRCLTVMGDAPDETPGLVAIGFVMEHGALKADVIHYQYLESTDDFPSDAVCPEELEPEFPS